MSLITLTPKDELPVAQFLTEAAKTYGGEDVMTILSSVAMAHQTMATTIKEQSSLIIQSQKDNTDRMVESHNHGATMISGELKLLREQLKTMEDRLVDSQSQNQDLMSYLTGTINWIFTRVKGRYREDLFVDLKRGGLEPQTSKLREKLKSLERHHKPPSTFL